MVKAHLLYYNMYSECAFCFVNAKINLFLLPLTRRIKDVNAYEY